jgi:hypothetical protein
VIKKSVFRIKLTEELSRTISIVFDRFRLPHRRGQVRLRQADETPRRKKLGSSDQEAAWSQATGDVDPGQKKECYALNASTTVCGSKILRRGVLSVLPSGRWEEKGKMQIGGSENHMESKGKSDGEKCENIGMDNPAFTSIMDGLLSPELEEIVSSQKIEMKNQCHAWKKRT